jgi:hypothetical protein
LLGQIRKVCDADLEKFDACTNERANLNHETVRVVAEAGMTGDMN